MSTTTLPPGKRIRVMIVDDSLFMRAAISKTLANGPFEIVGQAKSGTEALAQVGTLKPDVITMDFNMPGMNGADTVRSLMQQRPTPVVMFSAHTKQGAKETFDALSAGAVDFVTKPAGEVSVDLSKIAEELSRKLLAAASARPRATTLPPLSPGPIGHAPSAIPRTTLPGGLPRLCCVAISTGGPAALSEVIPALPQDLRLAVVVVQHMPAGFTAALAERLHASSKVLVKEAASGDRPLPGTVLIAPGDRHVEFDDNGGVVLTDGPLVNGCRPAADVTMLSAAKVYGRRALAVVMTGMGKDGAQGALAIKKAQGKTCAQDSETSVIYGMPKAAVETGAIDEICALGDIAAWMRYA
jgi:two-component system, chemotaxis family, protein-glutamate methylesterase/glutaminase